MTYNGYNDAKKRANNKYLSEKVDSITIRVPKGKKNQIASYAEQHELSVNAAINKMIEYCLEHPEMLD